MECRVTDVVLDVIDIRYGHLGDIHHIFLDDGEDFLSQEKQQ